MSEQPNNPLHGITLEQVVTQLEQHFGWQELGKRINIKCFNNDPSVKSSLKFLRKTPWARDKVEQLFVAKKLYLKIEAKQTSKAKTVKPKPEPEQEQEPKKQPPKPSEAQALEPKSQARKTRGSFTGNKNRDRSF